MYWNTTTTLLREILEALMQEPLFNCFRLVGGTALSLQLGHRTSADIDIFTGTEYGTINFKVIEQFLKKSYANVDTNHSGPVGLGITYFIGPSKKEQVKLDIFYTEPFIREMIMQDKIRIASVEDIIAMKLDIIGRGGRKKDFWDLHELHENFDLETMISLYQEKYPYGFSGDELRRGLQNFVVADGEPDPICLLGKHWELIKLDFVNWVSG